MFVGPVGATRNRPARKRSLAATLSEVVSQTENFASCRVFCSGEVCIPHNLVGNFAKGEGEAYGVGFETARAMIRIAISQVGFDVSTRLNCVSGVMDWLDEGVLPY